VLLPVWQAEFGLGYGELGALRALCAGAMAGFQVPAGFIAARIGGRALLALGTALSALGFLLAGASAGFVILAIALVVAGIGSSVQHPIASAAVADAYEGSASRQALGTYNFAGDIGKMTVPALTAWLVTLMPWRSAVSLLGLGGLAAACAIALLLPARRPHAPAHHEAGDTAPRTATGAHRRGFPVLLSIGVIDSATRMGFLTFLPFLLTQKGAGLPVIGLALTLVFTGGAVGKLVCGFLGARLGVLGTVFLTEGLTAVLILALLPLPLEAALVLAPVLGVALNGTSSVLYGTVPELVPPERRERAFALFYTGTVGSGAVAPALYGLVSDAAGIPAMMALVATVVMLTLPLVWMLRPALAR
jgi:FSR family fosmidomycin resistance protein-like MFS transporter